MRSASLIWPLCSFAGAFPRASHLTRAPLMLRRLLQWIDRRIDRAVTQVRTLHGIRVVVLNRRPDIQEEVLFERVEAGLGLIAEADPRRFRRLAQDFVELHVRRGYT